MPAETQWDTRLGSVLEGAYRITRVIGEGGMGAVYEAIQLRLNKRVAVKLMARQLTANQDALARFRREAAITSRLGHPNLVNVIDFGASQAGEPYLVMEYLDGEDLDQRLRRRGTVPVELAVHITKQTASALGAAHAQGIVHRDLKPANIFLVNVPGELEFVKVLDFGISKVKAAGSQAHQACRRLGHAKLHVARTGCGQNGRDRSSGGSVGTGLHHLGNALRPHSVRGGRCYRALFPGHEFAAAIALVERAGIGARGGIGTAASPVEISQGQVPFHPGLRPRIRGCRHGTARRSDAVAGGVAAAVHIEREPGCGNGFVSRNRARWKGAPAKTSYHFLASHGRDHRPDLEEEMVRTWSETSACLGRAGKRVDVDRGHSSAPTTTSIHDQDGPCGPALCCDAAADFATSRFRSIATAKPRGESNRTAGKTDQWQSQVQETAPWRGQGSLRVKCLLGQAEES